MLEGEFRARLAYRACGTDRLSLRDLSQGASADEIGKNRSGSACAHAPAGQISVDEVPDPAIADPADAIVRITTSAICGTDLHFVRGADPHHGMDPAISHPHRDRGLRGL